MAKLSPRYISLYEIIEKLDIVACRLDLPTELEHVHNVFHISQLRRYVPDPNHIIIAKPVEVAMNIMYEERPIQLLDCKVKQLRNKSIRLVKVLWTNHNSTEAIWETEEGMRSKYPYLFEIQTMLLSNCKFRG